MPQRRRVSSAGGWIAAAGMLVALALTLAWMPPSRSASLEPTVFRVYPPPGRAFALSGASVPAPELAVSPDGRHLAFVAAEPDGRAFVWLRTLSQPDATRLAGTEDAGEPFWKPDSRTLAFFSQGVLKKIDIGGTAPPEVIGRATVDMRGGAWGRGDAMLYVPAGNQGVLKMTSPGATPTALDLKDAAGPFRGARWPVFLPDGQHFLFQNRDRSAARKGSYVSSLDGSGTKRLVDSDWGPHYALEYLLVLTGSTLTAQPFDPVTHTLTGSPSVIAQQVSSSSSGYGSFSLSTTGVLAYSTDFVKPQELRWIDRTGGKANLSFRLRTTSISDCRLKDPGWHSRGPIRRRKRPMCRSEILFKVLRHASRPTP